MFTYIAKKTLAPGHTVEEPGDAWETRRDAALAATLRFKLSQAQFEALTRDKRIQLRDGRILEVSGHAGEETRDRVTATWKVSDRDVYRGKVIDCRHCGYRIDQANLVKAVMGEGCPHCGEGKLAKGRSKVVADETASSPFLVETETPIEWTPIPLTTENIRVRAEQQTGIQGAPDPQRSQWEAAGSPPTPEQIEQLARLIDPQDESTF
jgi:predicted  nucleic acid-binding Zn-ribbon protein